MPELWDQLGAWGSGLPAWVVAMTLWSGTVFAAVLAADWLLRRHVGAGWRAALYLAVLVRVALPTDWASPVNLWSATSSTAEIAVAGEPGTDLVAPDAPALIGATGDGDVEAAAVGDVASSPVRAGHGLAAGYGVGALGLLAWLVVARRRMARALAQARPARARARAFAPGREILEHDEFGPLAFGLVRPVVVLPRDLVDELDDASLGCVVAHEVAHLDRRDPALALAISVISCVAWPLIPVWLAGARVRQLIELAADARALDTSRARVYGETLIRLAERPVSRTALAAGVYLGSFSRLRGRVAALRERSALPRGLQIGATVAVAVGVLACAGIEGDEVDDPDALARRCESLKEQATRLHDQRERTKDAAAGAEAARAYDAYAQACEADPDYAEVLYYRAELRWAAGSDAWNAGDEEVAKAHFAQAHDAFVEALDEHPEKYAEDAAHGQLLAKWNALEVDVDDEQARPAAASATPGASKFPRSSYTPNERGLLATYDTFQGHVDDPSNPELQKVLYHRAKLAMQHNRFDEAEAAARALLDGSDGTVRHVWAAEMLADVLTIAWVNPDATAAQKATAERALARWLERVSAMQLYQRGDATQLREAVPRLKAGIAWKQGMRAYEAGRGEECAEIFTRLAAEHPEHDKLEEIERNAASCRALAGR